MPKMPRLLSGPRLIWLALATGAVLLIFGLVMSSPKPSDLAPNPNGYDDLVAAGRTLEGAFPNQGDWTLADLAELRVFVANNQPALQRVRLGLSREGLADFADSHQGLDDLMRRQGQIKTVTRLLLAAARLAFEDGRYADQVRLDLEILAVGQMMTQGSIGGTATMGWFVQGQALDQLKRLHDHLDTIELRASLRELSALDQRRVTPEAIERREARWYAGTYLIWQRLILRANGSEAVARAAGRKMYKEKHDQTARSMRYLLVQWAIHQFHQESGRWPRSVDELVPSILSRVPLNPDTNQPLIYPANLAGELTDNLAGIGMEDGSIKPAASPSAPISPEPDLPTTNPQPPPPPASPAGRP